MKRKLYKASSSSSDSSTTSSDLYLLLHVIDRGYAIFIVPGVGAISNSIDSVRFCEDLNKISEVVQFRALEPFDSIFDDQQKKLFDDGELFISVFFFFKLILELIFQD